MKRLKSRLFANVIHVVTVAAFCIAQGLVLASDNSIGLTEEQLSFFADWQAGKVEPAISDSELKVVGLVHPELKNQLEMSDWRSLNPYEQYDLVSQELVRIWSDGGSRKSDSALYELMDSRNELSKSQRRYFERQLEMAADALLRQITDVGTRHRMEFLFIDYAQENLAESEPERVEDLAQCFGKVRHDQYQCSLESDSTFRLALKNCAVLVLDAGEEVGAATTCNGSMISELSSSIEECSAKVEPGYDTCFSVIWGD